VIRTAGQLARIPPTTRLSRVRISRPLRPFGGTQDRRDRSAAGVEDHDRLETVLVVVGVEQLELLGAVGGIEGVVQIEGCFQRGCENLL
jgi:hypothetical protein